MKTALITGPSSGIGYELARLFAADGYGLVLVSSNKEKLETAAKRLSNDFRVPIQTLVKDLSLVGAARELYDELARQKTRVDVLVNNAGFGGMGPFATTDWAWESHMIQLNVMAMAELAKFYGRDMAARGEGKILNVASTAAFQPGPLQSVYYATKAFVLSLSEAMSWELRRSGVTVTALCPGPTSTEFGKRANIEKTFLFSGIMKMAAAPVALAGYKGLMRGERLVIPGFMNQFLVFSLRFFPRVFALKVVEMVQKEMVP